MLKLLLYTRLTNNISEIWALFSCYIRTWNASCLLFDVKFNLQLRRPSNLLLRTNMKIITLNEKSLGLIRINFSLELVINIRTKSCPNFTSIC